MKRLADRRQEELKALEERARDNPERVGRRRLAAMRAEAGLVRRLARYRPERLEHGHDLPFGPARAPLERASIAEIAFDPKVGDLAVTQRQVSKRQGPTGLSRLAPVLRAAGERYAELVAQVDAPGGRDPDAPRCAGVSDGGITSRIHLAARLDLVRRQVPRGFVPLEGRRGQPLVIADLVDLVCLAGEGVSSVLAAWGWSRRAENARAAKLSLELSLARMARFL